MPLALAVVFAMLPSYLLSRTLVTTMMEAMLGKELDLYAPATPGEERVSHLRNGADSVSSNGDPMVNLPRFVLAIVRRAFARMEAAIWRVHERFERHFEALRDTYRHILDWSLHNRALTCAILVAFFLGSCMLMPFIGEDFFPKVDAGQMRLHVRVPPGTRLEQTARKFSEIEGSVRRIVPRKELALIMDNVGLANGMTYVRSNSGSLGGADGEIDISLTESHESTWDYETAIRKEVTKEFPDCTFYFQPADMPTQVLDFGTSAPIDVQVQGNYTDPAANYALAQEILHRSQQVQGIVDAYIYQVEKVPELRITIDRSKALQMGVTQAAVAGNILVSLSSSSLVSPSYYLDTVTGYSYSVASQVKQYRINSVDALLSTPVAVTNAAAGPQPALLNNLATVGRDTTPQVVSSYNILPVFDVYASVENRDLGGATSDVQKIVNEVQKHAPRGTTVRINGQALTMKNSFVQLGLGLIFAIMLIYLLLTVNFESWIDPLIILMASPGALSGVLWGLFVTRSTFNVPSLMGAIMSVGVATANSILLVTFANDLRHEGKDALHAALEAGFTRFRPVIMTALAMVLGMLPMALGLGDGGEQNAPLGRAVIGGLGVATCTTLIFVPIMYTIMRQRMPLRTADLAQSVAPMPSYGDSDGSLDGPALI
jgi:multidrug efflux pump subunit AcrB